MTLQAEELVGEHRLLVALEAAIARNARPVGAARLGPGLVRMAERVQPALARLATDAFIADVARAARAAGHERVADDAVVADADRSRIDEELEGCRRTDLEADQVRVVRICGKSPLLLLPGL